MKDYVRNEYGIKVFRICASCAHKVLNDSVYDRHRKCLVDGSDKHLPSDACEHWEMNKYCANAGKGGGEVRQMAQRIAMLDKECMYNGENGSNEKSKRKAAGTRKSRRKDKEAQG